MDFASQLIRFQKQESFYKTRGFLFLSFWFWSSLFGPWNHHIIIKFYSKNFSHITNSKRLNKQFHLYKMLLSKKISKLRPRPSRNRHKLIKKNIRSKDPSKDGRCPYQEIPRSTKITYPSPIYQISGVRLYKGEHCKVNIIRICQQWNKMEN